MINLRRFEKRETQSLHLVRASAAIFPRSCFPWQEDYIARSWKSSDILQRNQIDPDFAIREFEAVLAHALERLTLMEKRLRLAKRLLKPDGVLVITIDEHEVHHLGMLLERVFPDARRQMVTICINPSGASGEGLSRVEEYAFYCFLGKSGPVKTGDDLLSATTKAADYIRWEALMRGGNAWYRAKRPNLCYPIVLTRDGNQIVGVGDPLPFHDKEAADAAEESRRSHTLKRSPLAWPVRKDGKLGIWRVDGTRLMDLVKDGYAYVSSRDEERQTWTIRYLMSGTVKAIERGLIAVVGKGDRLEALLRRKVARETTAKTVWHRGRHTAGGAGGTHMLAKEEFQCALNDSSLPPPARPR